MHAENVIRQTPPVTLESRDVDKDDKTHYYHS